MDQLSTTTAPADVVVVGFGPVGQALSALLGAAGHRVTVVERFTEPYGLPRAIRFDGEAMRMFQRLGIADAVQEDAVPADHYLWYGADGELIVDLDLTVPHPSGWASDWLFFQPRVEAALIGAAEAAPTVQVLRGCTVTAISQDDDGVDVAIARWDGDDVAGEPQSLRASYVVAADGANSSVREALGIAWDDLGFAEHWLVCDVRPNDEAVMQRYPTAAQFCDPARPHTLVRNGKHHRRWEFQLLPGEQPERFLSDPSSVWELLGRYIAPQDGEIIRMATYQFRSLLAAEMQQGRVFLAGDAAHLMPPFMGEGMCSGLRDANNLAWKLDQVLSGTAPATLLDTYGTERRAQNEAAVQISLMMGQVSCTLDSAAAAQRDEAFRQGLVPPPPKLPGLVDGLVAREPDGALAPAAGEQGVQPTLVLDGREGRFDELRGGGFALLTTTGDPAELLSPDQQAFLERIGATTTTLDPDVPGHADDRDGRLTAWLKEGDLQAVLVRPDSYVFGGARRAEDVAGLVEQLRSGMTVPEPAVR